MRCCYGILLLGLCAGCMESAPVKTSNTDNQDNTSHTVNKPVVNDTGSVVKDSAPVPATPRDNTAINERDQNSAAKTPFDQGNDESDVNITAKIRQKIVNHKDANDEGMSINARNVKIITEGKHVTLRGPVSNANEKTTIEKFAKEVAGPENVTNQLELAPASNP